MFAMLRRNMAPRKQSHKGNQGRRNGISKESHDISRLVAEKISAAIPAIAFLVSARMNMGQWNPAMEGTPTNHITNELERSEGFTNPGQKRKVGTPTGQKNDGNTIKKQKKVRDPGAVTQVVEQDSAKKYDGTYPKCLRCNYHHLEDFPVCHNYNQVGHRAKCCGELMRYCYECGSLEHMRDNCRRVTNQEKVQYFGSNPKCNQCNYYHLGDCPVCSKCNRVGHYTKYCRADMGNKKQKAVKNFGVMTRETGPPTKSKPWCNKCSKSHIGGCRRCYKCNQVGHYAKHCTVNTEGLIVCYECGSPDHYRNTCPKLNNGPNGNCGNPTQQTNQGNQTGRARGRAFVTGAEGARQDTNVVTGTFP